MNLWNAHPIEFVKTLRDAGLRRAYLVTNSTSGELVGSHPAIDSLRDAVAADTRDYRKHEGCFFEIGRDSGQLLSAHVHMTRRGQAAGGVRFWKYDTMEAFVRDGLRLSVGMGHKNALAGLWSGGGKGVVARQPDMDYRDPKFRRGLYRDYGRFMSGLSGCYITAEDAGTTAEDMAQVFSATRHTTCIPKELGGSGNPSQYTARGVVVAMEAALDHMDLGNLSGKTVALQGLGNVSYFMIEELIGRDVAKIIGTDIDEGAVQKVKDRYNGAQLDVRTARPGDDEILATQADVLAPNAVGAILNEQTIPTIRAKLVCGGANNQLEEPTVDDIRLHEKGIVYIPDFLANRMGIVNCANEQYGYMENDPAITAHLAKDNPTGIFRRTQEVLTRAKESGNTTATEAQKLADELALELHPIWGHRGQQIINYLVQSDWDKDNA
jgi:glutamate dehydrogenase (NAD(P)+)